MDTADIYGFFSPLGLKKTLTLAFALLPQKHKNHKQETGLANWEVRVSDDARDRRRRLTRRQRQRKGVLSSFMFFYLFIFSGKDRSISTLGVFYFFHQQKDCIFFS